MLENQYYAYNNIDDDDFGVGWIGTKKDWVERVNRFNRNDGMSSSATVKGWDELDCKKDFRGIELAVVEPDGLGSYIVRWSDKKGDKTAIIDNSWKIAWASNKDQTATVPRWINRLKNTLKENNL